MNPERGYPMKIHIVVIAYGLPEDTEKLLACKPLSKKNKFHVDDTDLVHQGSANINIIPDLMEQHHQTFTSNKAYYIRKWGGEPGKERFTQPFNDLRFSTRIAISDCGHPYWGFEREDREIVKI